MGAGSSASLDTFGSSGDVGEVKKVCADIGIEFDQKKFDELKDSEGKVTRAQLQELFQQQEQVGGTSSIIKTSNKKRPPPRIIISGAPASGKGTQAERISSEFNVVHLSTGDMLRAEVAKNSEVGMKAKEYMNQGKLVPDEVMIAIVIARIAEPDCMERGWLLDGFPRTDDQAQALNEHGVSCDVFVHLDVPDEALVDRVIGRRSDPVTGKIYHMQFNPPPEDIKERLVQRADDTAEKVKTRIKAFHENLNPLLNRYKDKTLTIDGNQKADNIWSKMYGSIARSVKYSVVFVLGGPKSGKRSYCKLLANSFGYDYICPLDMIKERGSPNMTSEEVIAMILGEMEKSENKSKKFIMDAFPRSKDDLRVWFDTMGDQCLIDHVVYLEVPEKLARERIAAEAPEMTEEEINVRFKHFNDFVLPLVATFQWLGKVRKHTAVNEVSVGFDFLSKFFTRKGNKDSTAERTTAEESSGYGMNDGAAPIHHRSLAIIKPDIISKNKETGNVNKILQAIINAKDDELGRISIVSYRLVQMTPEIAAGFYDVHKGKPFFNELIQFMSSGPVLVLILNGRDVMRRWREIMGATDPSDKNKPHTLRALYGTDIIHNAVHGSSSEGAAFEEIDFWTREDGLGVKAQEVSSADYGIDVPSEIMFSPFPEHPSYEGTEIDYYLTDTGSS